MARDHSSGNRPVVDKLYIGRVESIHRGFLYQHLYAVGCILNLMSLERGYVAVERDEDIELVTDSETCFIQVKTRSRPLQTADIDDALERFANLRDSHNTSFSEKTVRFAIVSNVNPGPALAKRIDSTSWPSDVSFSSPGRTPAVHTLAPPPWDSIGSAIEWCIGRASELAFQSLNPETLVWKLSARVHFAASGEDSARPNHQFVRADLPALFELFIQQLYKFPAIPEDYRPQHDEPCFDPDCTVQLVIGFSGAGKTVWSSWQAHHISAESVYFDIGDLSGPALASSIARELTARFISGSGTGSAQLPAGTGLETLRFVAQAIDLPEPPFVVIDNVHRVKPEHLRQVVEACSSVRFVLMGQPCPHLRRLESLLKSSSIELPGWDIDTIAQVFTTECTNISPLAARGWRQLTSGLPLYVQSAARLCKEIAGGDADRFLEIVRRSDHPVDLAQEAILALVIDNLTEDERNLVAALSLAQSRLTEEECRSLMSALPVLDGRIAPTLRALSRNGLIQTYADGSRKLHDALYVQARGLFGFLDIDIQLRLKCQLRDILFSSLEMERDLTRLGAWLRLLGPTGRVDILVDIASSEMFHELGEPSDLKEVLLDTANEAGDDKELQYWALDAIVFWELQEDTYVRNPEPHLGRLEALVERGSFTARQQVAVIMKRMIMSGMEADDEAVERAFQVAQPLIESDDVMSRIVRYNYASAMFHSGSVKEALEIAEELYCEYYDVLGIDVSDVFGANPTTMEMLVGERIEELQDDLKHLADCLSLAAMCSRSLGNHPGLLGIHAAKFFQLAGAHRSQMKVAQDVVDDFIKVGEMESALQIMESSVVPLLNQFEFDGQMMDVRGQYAVVLAYNGRIADARTEMEAIEPYVAALPQWYQGRLVVQRRIIEELSRVEGKRHKGPAQLAKGGDRSTVGEPKKRTKIGRNALCPCGLRKEI